MTNSSIKGSLLLVIITYLAFISLGLPDGLLGIAWPYMSQKYGLSLDSLGVLLVGFTLGYLSTSTTSGKIMGLLPLGLILTISCCITGLSLLIYAFSGYWYLVIVASFFLGSGGGAIDASINTFAASHFSPSIVNWLHAFYGIGATLGPLIITTILSFNRPWQYGYIVVGIIQLTLSAIFLFTLNYWRTKVDNTSEATSQATRLPLTSPVVWLNVLIFFLYTGLESGIGQWIFTLLTTSRHINEETAGLWTSSYWGSLTAGRIIFGVILTKISVNKVLAGAFLGIAAGCLLLTFPQLESLSLMGIIIIGFSNAPIFPSLISVTPNRVGANNAPAVIGFQISAAMVGSAFLPSLAGILTDYFTFEIIPKFFLGVSVILLLLYFLPGKKY